MTSTGEGERPISRDRKKVRPTQDSLTKLGTEFREPRHKRGNHTWKIDWKPKMKRIMIQAEHLMIQSNTRRGV